MIQGTAPRVSGGDKIKVMIVDDSAVIRGLLTRALESDGAVEIVSSVHNGQLAVKAVQKAAPDVIVLDIEMPVMDGITALPLLLEQKPDAKILICSTLSSKGASVSLKALSLGATECLVKPTSTSDIGGSKTFQDELLRLVKALGGHKEAPKPALAGLSTPPRRKDHSFTLRRKDTAYDGKPAIIAIGSSTGGPQALFQTLRDAKNIDVPIVITQHMPKMFTAILAKHIEQHCGIPCFEAAQDMTVENGKAYVAPGGYHMEIVKDGLQLKINISDAPPENYCKPSVEPMMRSIIKLFGKKVLGVMLTGMGSDGLDGFRQLADEGGYIIAQDEETSVVWGMPGAVAMDGICVEVLPLSDIAAAIARRSAHL